MSRFTANAAVDGPPGAEPLPEQHFGNELPPAGVLLIAYVIGQLGGLVPIPGGVGSVDGGLIGALVLYGTGATQAAVAVLAYRALVLWLPIGLGVPSIASLRR